MLYPIQRLIHITINCCTFTHPERLDFQKLPSLHIPVTFSLRPAFITWPIFNRTTFSTHHCRCIIRPAALWASDKHFSLDQPLLFARNSPLLDTSPTAKNINARYVRQHEWHDCYCIWHYFGLKLLLLSTIQQCWLIINIDHYRSIKKFIKI